MSIQAYGTFEVLLVPDGSSTSFSFDVRDVPLVAQMFSGLPAPLYSPEKATGLNINFLTDGTGSNVTANITSSSFQKHVLTVVLNTALAANTPGNSASISFNLLF